MSSKLALSLLLLMLGLASWDAVLDHEDYTQSTPTEEDGQVRTAGDGTPFPP